MQPELNPYASPTTTADAAEGSHSVTPKFLPTRWLGLITVALLVASAINDGYLLHLRLKESRLIQRRGATLTDRMEAHRIQNELTLATGIRIALSVAFWTLIVMGLKLPPMYGLAFPLGAVVTLVMVIRSLSRGDRRVVWRGREYSAVEGRGDGRRATGDG